MKKTLFPAFFILFLSLACSAFMGQGNLTPGLSLLPVLDGSYLSSDKANEITPFYYYDTNGGKNCLFFSSDRDGSYDLYYAEMNEDGSFKDPVKMDSNINTSADEFSPVLYYGPFSMMAGGHRQFVSFLRKTAGQTNMMVVMLGSNYTFGTLYPSISNVTFSRIALFNQTNIDGSPLLIACAGQSNWYLRSWGLGAWDSLVMTNKFIPSVKPIYAMNGYLEEWSVGANQYTNYFIFESDNSGKRQLFLGKIGFGALTNVSAIPLYASGYNDREPDIDLKTMKVYFSSDRRGTYDLYRYNIATFDKVRK